ncbi:MFS transporter [Pseudomonas sp. 5P_3.1_Bac2]|uniref:MFS transporter n=1 Tax=Pseudomonas sp. 5P_3.1_Bac2 TaxID=2971617 RepID=UPI0021C61017|nr:MFS transporter [Pseudomonas sp. 5P_3.1_Bac2]MCU1719508.1 MFS transporter [Pseudomonas sp. 5P_3.1_Bac2]
MVLLMLYVMSILDRLALNMLVVPIQKEMGFTDVQMSLIIGPAFAIAHGLFAFPLGWACDRLSRRKVLFGGFVVWSTATVTAGLAKTFPMLFASRVVVGAAEASLMPAAYSMIADRVPRHRMTTAMSIFGMGPKLGNAFAFGVGGWVIAYTASVGTMTFPMVGEMSAWRSALILLGAPGVLLALLVFTFREPIRRGISDLTSRTKQVTEQVGEIAFKDYIKQRKTLYILLLLGFSCTTMAALASLSWVPTYITRHFGLTPKEYAPALSILYAVGACTMLLKGIIIDWLYKRGYKDAHVRFYTFILVLALPAIGIAFTTDDFKVFVVAYAALDVILLNSVFYVSATIQLMAPTHLRGRVMGMFILVVGTVAPTLSPPLVATITEHVFKDQAMLGYSLISVSATSVVLAIIVLAISLRYLRPEMQRVADDNEAKIQASHDAEAATGKPLAATS